VEYVERLSAVRKAKGITQRQVCDALNITQQQYSKYERGVNELPIRYLIEICRFLDISADWLLGLKDHEY